MSNTLPFSTLDVLLEQRAFASEPRRALQWGNDLLNAGFSTEAVFDLVATEPSEWQRVARLLPGVIRSLGIDLSDDDQLRRTTIDLISQHLASGGTGQEMIDIVDSRPWHFDTGWRAEIEGLFVRLLFDAEDIVAGILPAPDEFDPPHLIQWVTAAWRDLLREQGWA